MEPMRWEVDEGCLVLLAQVLDFRWSKTSKSSASKVVTMVCCNLVLVEFQGFAVDSRNHTRVGDEP